MRRLPLSRHGRTRRTRFVTKVFPLPDCAVALVCAHGEATCCQRYVPESRGESETAKINVVSTPRHRVEIRKKVVVNDVPYTWSTNLDDDGIREFHSLFALRIREPDPPLGKLGEKRPTIRIPFRMAFLEFRDGRCLWFATKDHHTVLYRTNYEWELFNAGNAEVEELRSEQAAERTVERTLFEIEDRHLAEKTENAIKQGQYDLAAECVVTRLDLSLKAKQFSGTSRVTKTLKNAATQETAQIGFTTSWRLGGLDGARSAAWVFTRFPTSKYGIEFLRKYDAKPEAFANFAHWFAARCGLLPDECVAQTWMIYEEGMRLFPDNSCLIVAACLFWRRVRRYDLAIKICSEAIKKGIKDGTRSGFEGRIKRLEKEAGRQSRRSPD